MSTLHHRVPSTERATVYAPRLPDEILSEIFSYSSIHVPDEKFANITRNTLASTFANFGESTSAYLLVCSSWLRVATPLLYRTVILRSAAQAQALAATLEADPELGEWIKKLRLECAYAAGPFVHTVLKYAPNITDLFLSLELRYGVGDVEGLVEGLLHINPHRLILHPPPKSGLTRFTKKLRHEITETCIPAWTNLTTIKLGCKHVGRRISFAIKDSTSLQTVILFDEYGRNGIDEETEAPITELSPGLLRIAENPQIKRIVLEPPLFSRRQAFDDDEHFEEMATIFGGVRMRRLMRLGFQPSDFERALEEDETVSQSQVVPWEFKYPAQLAGDPVLADRIWGLVLDFYFADPAMKLKNGKSVALVCQMFARLSRPYVYETLKLKSWGSIEGFQRRIRVQPTYAGLVRNLEVSARDSSVFRDNIHLFTGLVSFECFDNVYPPRAPMSHPELKELGRHSGNTLERLSISISPPTRGGERPPPSGFRYNRSSHRSGYGRELAEPIPYAMPRLFNTFHALKYLHLDSNVEFAVEYGDCFPDALPELVTLSITVSHIYSMLEMFSMMSLPKLREVIFNKHAIHVGFGPDTGEAVTIRKFFTVHGRKLHKVTASSEQMRSYNMLCVEPASALDVLGRCPMLRELTIACLEYHFNEKGLEMRRSNPFLEKITLQTSHAQLKEYALSFEDFTNEIVFSAQAGRLPQWNREIVLQGYEWPTTEDGIRISATVEQAEVLLEHGVYLVDGNGFRWRPRLKLKVPEKEEEEVEEEDEEGWGLGEELGEEQSPQPNVFKRVLRSLLRGSCRIAGFREEHDRARDPPFFLHERQCMLRRIALGLHAHRPLLACRPSNLRRYAAALPVLATKPAAAAPVDEDTDQLTASLLEFMELVQDEPQTTATTLQQIPSHPKIAETVIQFLFERRMFPQALTVYQHIVDAGFLPLPSTDALLLAVLMKTSPAPGHVQLADFKKILSYDSFTESHFLELLQHIETLEIPAASASQLARLFIDVKGPKYEPSRDLLIKLIDLDSQAGNFEGALGTIEQSKSLVDIPAEPYARAIRSAPSDSEDAVDWIMSLMSAKDVPIHILVFNALISRQRSVRNIVKAFTFYNIILRLAPTTSLKPDGFTYKELFRMVGYHYKPNHVANQSRQRKRPAILTTPRQLFFDMMTLWFNTKFHTHESTIPSIRTNQYRNDEALLTVAFRAFLYTHDYQGALVALQTFPLLGIPVTERTYLVLLRYMARRVYYDILVARKRKTRPVYAHSIIGSFSSNWVLRRESGGAYRWLMHTLLERYRIGKEHTAAARGRVPSVEEIMNQDRKRSGTPSDPWPLVNILRSLVRVEISGTGAEWGERALAVAMRKVRYEMIPRDVKFWQWDRKARRK
uniref:F-box domain-containing protein n=1 Tax=Mycena chlorophos TaxID=658473 RepID=A0ABQ0LC04_MYCCL|nr:predicted protein [Mycena chlorophos]